MSSAPAAKRFMSPMPLIPRDTLRSILPRCGHNQAVLAYPSGTASKTVIYFPGCGSERLFSDIGKASIYLLLKQGFRVVVPPPYLCCGFPAKANSDTEQATMLFLRNTIIFSQIREMFSDLTFDGVIISCGTCREALTEMNVGSIFKTRITDISQVILAAEDDLRLGPSYLYHTPCHDSLNGEGISLLEKRTDKAIISVPYCCSEAGTMALSRPDISNAMLERKKEAIESAIDDPSRLHTLLTNCPSCIQGLSRTAGTTVHVAHLAVELAQHAGGPHWENELVETLKNCDMITF